MYTDGLKKIWSEVICFNDVIFIELWQETVVDEHNQQNK